MYACTNTSNIFFACVVRSIEPTCIKKLACTYVKNVTNTKVKGFRKLSYIIIPHTFEIILICIFLKFE